MASSSADCVLGGVRLISSASRMLPKIGPGTNVQRRWPVVGSSSMMSVPVMSDGMRSGVNWMRLKTRPSVCAIVRTISVFAVPGKAGDQAVAADEQRDEDLVEHFFLPDDHLADLREDAVAHRMEAIDALLQLRGVEIDFSGSGHWSIFLSRNP